ncbi:MAG: 2-oxoacid:acceptor oxidoreductase subunit alpha [Xanthomonadales bacterium]|nr:2-oxoacid:acceptor oxidoreductase subunit alpha [Xanthomonadales bacterium]
MSTTETPRETVRLDAATIRFAGDSGDGMQLTGTRFTNESAVAGNDLATLPDYPAEIRAPAGTLAGVSSFQLQFAAEDIHTPGDEPDVLVAMNPAALKKHLPSLRATGTLIIDEDAFTSRNLNKAGFDENPLEDGSLEDYDLHAVQLTSLTLKALEEFTEDGRLNRKEAERAKNMFALGLVSWMFSRSLDTTEKWLQEKFAKRPELVEANIKALRTGRNFGDTTESFKYVYEVPPAELEAGTYRNVSGNQAVAWGLVAAANRAGMDLFYGSYPITPASDILHELSRLKRFGVRTFQAEDEIAAMSSTVGAAFGGALAVTASSGPGIALKGEAIGLALMTELPVVIVDVQRGGPSTGLPTKTEQSDLNIAMYGRNGESPIPVLAATSPSDAFFSAYEAARIAVENRTPVLLLMDGYLANSSEPWNMPDPDTLNPFDPQYAAEPNTPEGFLPYLRDGETLARPWAVPGTSGLEHRLGGLEKDGLGSGNISYDPSNHHEMTVVRQEKVDRIADRLDPIEVDDPDGDAELLLVGWGSTDGPLRSAVHRLREDGHKVAHMQLRHLSPLRRGVDEAIKGYPKVLCAENNLGQLTRLLRARTLVDIQGHHRVTGLPFTAAELVEVATDLLTEESS